MEKVILDIKPKSFYYRFWFKNLLQVIAIYTCVLLFLDGNIFIDIIITSLFAFISSVVFIYEYKNYTYKIVVDNKRMQIFYYRWYNKMYIQIDLNHLRIQKEIRVRVRSIVEQISFIENNLKVHIIFPEVGFFRQWTEERVSELYDKLIETQNEVKARYENEGEMSDEQ